MTKPKYHIAVTGLNAIDSPGPGISIIRALREAKSFDVRIIGLSYETLEPGIYMHDLVDHTYQIPYPSAGQQNLLDRLEYINSVENIDFLFPNFDAELYNFIKLADKIEQDWNIKMFLPTMKQFEDREKVNLMAYGKKHGIDVPKDKQILKAADLYSLGEQFTFPVVVKGKFYESGIAYNTDQAVQLFNKISTKWGLPVLVQEFIYGTEVNVCGVGDGNGTQIGAVPMRKLYITDKGKAWTGIAIDDEDLLKLTSDWIKSTQWRGPFELEVMKTTDDQYFLMEINPRFPAWVYLTNGCGQNQVEAVVNMAMGKKVKPFTTYEVGKMFIRYSYDMIVDIAEFEKYQPTEKFNIMQKTLIILMAFAGTFVYAQPVITSSVMPVIGDTIIRSFADTNGVNPGKSGANITWDFTGLKATTLSYRYYVDPLSTPYVAKYVNATVCRVNYNKDYFSYWKVTPSKAEYHGLTQTSVVDFRLTEPADYFIFPATYGTNSSDSVYALTYNGTLKSSGKMYFNADAYGTLNLPRCTFKEVLRVKTVLYVGDSNINSYSKTTEYTWFNRYYKDILLVVGYTEINHVTTKYVLFNNDSFGLVGISPANKQNNPFRVFPNPASGKCFIQSENSEGSSFDIQITDLSGKVLLTKNNIRMLEGQNIEELDVQELKPGFYLIQFRQHGSLYINKFIIR